MLYRFIYLSNSVDWVVLDGAKALRYGISAWGLLLVKGRCVGLLGEGAMGCWLEGRAR